MDETQKSSTSSEHAPDSRDFISVWTTATMCHLGLVLSVILLFSGLPHRVEMIIYWAVGAFAVATLKLFGMYSIRAGSDAWFFGIMFVNSLLYGLIYTIIWWHFSHRVRRRRGFPVVSGAADQRR